MPTYQVLLIGNGAAVPTRYLRRAAKQAAYVLAVDGGADRALKAGVEPDSVIGDLDSISSAARTHMGARVWHVSTQENTDLEKALSWVAEHQISSVLAVGFVGGRWDFSVGNLLVLAKYAHHMDVAVAGPGWRMMALTGSRQFDSKPGQRVSIIPLTPCTGVTLAGLKYLLSNEDLQPGTTRTLSNETTEKTFTVSFKTGRLLVYQEE